MNKRDRLPVLVIVSLVLFCVCVDIASAATSTAPPTPIGTTEATSAAPTTTPDSTAAATTDAATSTAPATTTTTTTTTTTAAPATASNTVSLVGQCPCDVTGNACDINCCCDEECSDADKQAFCPPSSQQQDGGQCFPKELFLFENSDTVRSETTEDGFCIYPENSGDSSVYTQPNLVTTLSAFQEYQEEFSSFSFQPPAVSDAVLNATFYKSGDPIYTVTNTEAIGVLGLPRSLTTSDCVDSNPAAYLSSERFSCVRNIDDLTTQCGSTPALDATNYFSGFRVVTSPELFQSFNTTVNETEQGFRLYNSTLTTELKLDNRSSVAAIRCQDYTTGVITPCLTTTLPPPSFQAGVCSNVLVQVDYAVVTQGSSGIADVLARFIITSVPVPASGRVSLMQTFSTSFESGGTSGSVVRSGNPGYIVGRPVLAGTLNQTTDSSGAVTERIEVNPDRNLYMTFVRSSATGDCVTAAEDRGSVLFGRDVSTGCRLSVSANNLTDYCTRAQQSIISMLEFDSVPEATDSGYRDNNRYVGFYGNSDVVNTGDWVKILYQNRPLPTPPPSQTSSCRLSLGMQVQVMFANIGALLNPQPKIIAVVFTYDDPTDVQVTVPSSGQVTQAVSISTSVSFLDVSKEAVTYDPQPSIYDAKIPDDFFYPFITGTASRCGPFSVVLNLCLCVLVCFFW